MANEEQRPIIIDHHRQMVAVGVNLTDPDENGTRLFVAEMNTPDKFLFYLPDHACDYLKERLAGGVVLAKPGDIAKVSATKEGS